jgi:Fis family transcriptional regulator
MVIDSIEKPLIEYILEKTKFNQTEAAKMLGMNRNTLRKKIQLFNISINQ